jgi:hypothetical protein
VPELTGVNRVKASGQVAGEIDPYSRHLLHGDLANLLHFALIPFDRMKKDGILQHAVRDHRLQPLIAGAGEVLAPDRLPCFAEVESVAPAEAKFLGAGVQPASG